MDHSLYRFLLVSLTSLLTLAKYMLEPVVCTLNARPNLSAEAVTLNVALLFGVIDCLVKLCCFNAIIGTCAVARDASAGFSGDQQ